MKTGAVLVFADGIDVDRAMQLLESLNDPGGGLEVVQIVTSIEVQTFDPDEEQPVWRTE